MTKIMSNTETKKKTSSKKGTIKVPKNTKKEGGDVVLRIRVRAYDSKVLDSSVKQIIDTALRYDGKVLGPVPLPTEIKNIQ